MADLERELDRGAGLVVVLDYDGTLTPIVASPGAAALAPSVRATLARLARSERVRLAILSGRALADVRTRVALDDVVYGGCHGLEIAGAGLRFRHPRVRAATLTAPRRALAAATAAIPGAQVEFKGLALSLHYRRVPGGWRGRVRALAAEVARRRPRLAVIPGNRVFDFVPRVGWDKGAAARWIADRMAPTLPSGRAFVLYVGDDTTDEAAFAALRGRAVTVRVGAGRSAADYRVAGVREVQALLRWIVRTAT